MTLFANVYMRYTLRAYVYEAEEKGFTCFDEINKLCTLLKLYLLLFVVKRVADRLVGSMSLLVGEESKQRREHSAEAANSERHRHLLHRGVASRQQVRVDRELHAAVKTLSRA